MVTNKYLEDCYNSITGERAPARLAKACGWHVGHQCSNLMFGTGSLEFILFISALAVVDQMVVFSLHRYWVRALTPILINLLASNQLDTNFIFNSITEKLSIGMVVWRSVL
jgi:hypothetical protein